MIFTNSDKIFPIWKGPRERELTLKLYQKENHFDVIKDIPMFFSKNMRKYCIDCEIFYTTDIKHKQDCPSRCNLCGRMGWNFPCMKEPNFEETCVECNRTFYNKKCLNNHRVMGKGMGFPMCIMRRRCIDCGKEYTYRKGKEHKCIKNKTK